MGMQEIIDKFPHLGLEMGYQTDCSNQEEEYKQQ